jgi:hypothetical protein
MKETRCCGDAGRGRRRGIPGYTVHRLGRPLDCRRALGARTQRKQLQIASACTPEKRKPHQPHRSTGHRSHTHTHSPPPTTTADTGRHAQHAAHAHVHGVGAAHKNKVFAVKSTAQWQQARDSGPRAPKRKRERRRRGRDDVHDRPNSRTVAIRTRTYTTVHSTQYVRGTPTRTGLALHAALK